MEGKQGTEYENHPHYAMSGRYCGLWVRALSAYIKEKTTHQVQLILLPGGLELLNHQDFAQYRYPQRVLEQIWEICQDSGFIGLSFMTNYFDRRWK
jgi:hypothetical protein